MWLQCLKSQCMKRTATQAVSNLTVAGFLIGHSNARNTSRISTSSRRVIFQGQFALTSLETSALADKSSFYKQYQVNRPFQGVRRAIKQIPVCGRTLINNWGCNCGRNFSLTVFTLRRWFLVASSTSYSSPGKRVWKLARGFELQGLPAHSATAESHCPYFTAFNYLLPHNHAKSSDRNPEIWDSAAAVMPSVPPNTVYLSHEITPSVHTSQKEVSP